MIEPDDELYFLNRGEHPSVRVRKSELIEFSKQPGLAKKNMARSVYKQSVESAVCYYLEL